MRTRISVIRKHGHQTISEEASSELQIVHQEPGENQDEDQNDDSNEEAQVQEKIDDPNKGGEIDETLSEGSILNIFVDGWLNQASTCPSCTDGSTTSQGMTSKQQDKESQEIDKEQNANEESGDRLESPKYSEILSRFKELGQCLDCTLVTESSSRDEVENCTNHEEDDNRQIDIQTREEVEGIQEEPVDGRMSSEDPIFWNTDADAGHKKKNPFKKILKLIRRKKGKKYSSAKSSETVLTSSSGSVLSSSSRLSSRSISTFGSKTKNFFLKKKKKQSKDDISKASSVPSLDCILEFEGALDPNNEREGDEYNLSRFGNPGIELCYVE